jgi:hypothetical protein
MTNTIANTTRAAQLLGLQQPGDSCIVPLNDTRFTIGTGPRCSLRLDRAGLRPLECLIWRHSGDYRIRRWHGTSRLNGHEFDEAILAVGDRLEIGDQAFVVAPLDIQPTSTVAAAPTDHETSATTELLARELRGEIRRSYRRRWQAVALELCDSRERCQLLEDSLAEAARELSQRLPARQLQADDKHATPVVSELVDSASIDDAPQPACTLTVPRGEVDRTATDQAPAAVDPDGERATTDLWPTGSDVAADDAAGGSAPLFARTIMLAGDTPGDTPNGNVPVAETEAEASDCDAASASLWQLAARTPADQPLADETTAATSAVDEPPAESAPTKLDTAWSWDIETPTSQQQTTDLWGLQPASDAPADLLAETDDQQAGPSIEQHESCSQTNQPQESPGSQEPAPQAAVPQATLNPWVLPRHDSAVAEQSVATTTAEVEVEPLVSPQESSDAVDFPSERSPASSELPVDEIASTDECREDSSPTQHELSPTESSDPISWPAIAADKSDGAATESSRVDALFAPTATEKVSSEPESFITRYAHLLEQQTDEPELPAVSTASTTADASTPAAEDEEDSIDSYMEKMLQRLRGEGGSDSSSKPTGPSPAVVVRPAASAVETEKPVESAPKLPLFTSLDEIKKSAAPESNHDLSAFRELANSSARHAIGASKLKQSRDQAGLTLVISAIVLASGSYLLATADQVLSLPTFGGAAMMVASTWWGSRTANSLLVTMRELQSAIETR